MSDEPNYTTYVNARANRLLKLKKRQLSLKQRWLPNFLTGFNGEQQAREYLLERGYQILDTNVVWARYEIDIIALDQTQHELAFIEVKTRKTNQYGLPSSAVTPKKLAAMQRVALAYCRKRGLQFDLRFDIISVTDRSIAHYQNVTWP